MSGQMNRRRFLQAGAAAAGVGYFAVADVTEARAARQNDPTNRLNIAIIGSGGQGGGNLRNVARSENIVALCDVDDSRAAGAYKEFPNAARFKDFRVMLEKQKDIDAVVVSTPDHTHFPASMMAMRLGKHVYCEKPLTHSIWEARQMREAAAKHKVATQMGNHGTASDGLRTNAEIVRSGALGEVREIHLWTNRPIWPQNIARPAPQPVPKTLDWDLWLGPAPERAYHPGVVPFAWRGFWDFGTGALGDMACHTMNMPWMALRLGAPTSIVADLDPKGSTHMNETAPMGCTVTYEFPARGELPPLRLYWYERRQPPPEKLMGQKPTGSGCLLVGAKGTLYASSDYGDDRRLLPEANFRDYKPPTPSIPRAPAALANGQSRHHAEWLRACKGGSPAMSNFVDYAGPLTETVLLGNVAMRAGKRIDWDAVNLRARDLPAADQFIRREYRKGWTV